MVREGFTAQIDIDAVPAGRTYVPANRFCADPYSTEWFRTDPAAKVCKGLLRTYSPGAPKITLERPSRPMRLSPVCNSKTPWAEAKAPSASSASTGGAASGTGSNASGTSQSVPIAGVSASGTKSATLTMKVPDQTGNTYQATGTAEDAKAPVTVTLSAPIAKKAKADPSGFLINPCTNNPSNLKVGSARSTYEMCIDGHIEVRLYLRSAFGVYEYLGQLLAHSMALGLYTGRGSDIQVLTITHQDNYCFVSTIFEGDPYCVPLTADNTKRIFALLRQLVALNTTVQYGQPTLTVRTTP